MKYDWVLIVFLLVAILAVSGCMEFGAVPTSLPPTPTPKATPTKASIPGAIGLLPSTQINATYKPVKYERRADMKQTDNITVVLKNTGKTNATNVYFSIKVKDGQTSDILHTDMIPVGNITPGKSEEQTVSVPPHKFLGFIVVDVTVYWGDNLEYGNEIKPWYVTLF